MDMSGKFSHGGNIHKLQREMGLAEGEIIDFSANINPLGVSPAVRQTIVESIASQVNYPDPDYVELREALSLYLDTLPQHIIVGNGATEIIYLFFRCLGSGKVLIPQPTFSEYERAARISGFKIEYILLEEKQDFTLNLSDIKPKINGVTALVLCNPNNPTGKLLEFEKLKKLLQYCRQHGVMVLLDEAFIEFVENFREVSAVSLIKNFPNLFVVRAFTKFFGIPGLRLGYGLTADTRFLRRLRTVKEPWSVNGLAAAAGIAALKDKKYIDKTVRLIKREREYLYKQLSQIKGITPYPSTTNFMLLKLENQDLDAQKLRDKLVSRRIVIRDASNFVGLDTRFVRIAVKDRKSNEVLINSLKAIGGEGD